MRVQCAEGNGSREERMLKRRSSLAESMLPGSTSGPGLSEPVSIPLAVAQPHDVLLPGLPRHTRTVSGSAQDRGDAVQMVRSYSLPVSTQDEHQESLRASHNGRSWWTQGWVACGNGKLELGDSDEGQEDAHIHIAQSPTTLPPIPASPEQTAPKRLTWSPQVTRRKAKARGSRDDCMLPEDDFTPDYLPSAKVMIEPKLPSHIIAVTRGDSLPGIVAPIPETVEARVIPTCTQLRPLCNLGEL